MIVLKHTYSKYTAKFLIVQLDVFNVFERKLETGPDLEDFSDIH